MSRPLSSASVHRGEDPHRDQPVRHAGTELDTARAAVILIHGRGATAESILRLAGEMEVPDVAFLAPQAAGRTWYPQSFLAPIDANEPGLSSGLRKIGSIRNTLIDQGITHERIIVGGFSQGACLATELSARHPRRYGGVFGWSGGLIGTDDKPDADPPRDKTFDYTGSLEETPVFLGCSDRDPHIPAERVHQTAEVLKELGGNVTKRIYEGMGHVVNEDEKAFVRDMITDAVEE